MAELPVVGQPAHRCGALIDHVARRMRTPSETVLAAIGLRPRQLVALTVLRDHGTSSQQLLADVLRIDPTNLVGLLNELEQGHLITRQRSHEDRRRHVVDLTTTGRAKLAEAEMALAAVEEEIFSGLTHDERETLYQLLLRASRDLTHAPPSCGE